VPPALLAKDLPGGQTQVLNVRQIKWIDRHPAEHDEDRSPESITDTKNCLNWNGDFDNPNDSEDEWEADNESEMELDNGSKDSETPELRNVSAAPNVPWLIWSIRRSNKKVEQAVLTVIIMETRNNKGFNKKLDRMRQCIITTFIMQFNQEFYLEKYYGRILTSHMRILVNKQSYSGQYALFGITYRF
jgi:hypothetical protein